MKILLDVNVLLDVFLNRLPWYADAARVWDAHRARTVTGFVAAFSVPTIFYVIRRQLDLPHAHDAVRVCLDLFEIAPVERSTLELARTISSSDYEDCLQIASALAAGLDAIVTRDPAGFIGATIPVLTPANLLTQIEPSTR